MVTTTEYKDAFVFPLKNPVTDEQNIFIFEGNGAHKMSPAQKRDYVARAINDILGVLPEGAYLEFGDIELLLQQKARYQPSTEVTLGSDTVVVRTGILRYVVDKEHLFTY